MSHKSKLPDKCQKKILQQMNLNDDCLYMQNQKYNTLDDINDILIVRKITEKDPKALFEEQHNDHYFNDEFDSDEENRLLAEEHEAIIKKQLQMLQADERGKKAIISEISAIKQKQEQRAEALKARQHALDIEKDRAKRIASLPPPLPKSVKSLLRKNGDENKSQEKLVHMPDELKAASIKLIDFENENKENILNAEEQAAKEKMQEEWSVKARKRFNEALRKDRQKEEYAVIMKQIESAELKNRREMAKNISSDKTKSVPCPLSDKFQTFKKQADMENAAEKLFKKRGDREHAIEDIEGYKDHYEEKYKKIDSEYETKMIDCVPDFVKENYEYLLEDESKFEGGKRFSGLTHDGSGIFNDAFIESPPVEEREKIDRVIDQLDQLRSEIQSNYDHTLKPLLIASLEKPKKEISDKAVEADLLKSSVEDKAVETDTPFQTETYLDSSFDYRNYGVLTRKGRPYKPILLPFYNLNTPDMHEREVVYTVPGTSESERLDAATWSASSYCSLPSKHGFPEFASSSASPKCDICAAEKRKKLEMPHVLPQTSFAEDLKKSKPVEKDGKISAEGKSGLSSYVQQVAEKYLRQKPPAKESIESDYHLPVYSPLKLITPAFEKEHVPESYPKSVISDHLKSEKLIPVDVKDRDDFPMASLPVTSTVSDKEPVMNEESDHDLRLRLIKTSEIKFDNLQDIYKETVSSDSVKNATDINEYEAEVKRIQMIHDVLSRRLPHINSRNTDDYDSNASNNTKSGCQTLSTGVKEIIVKPHVYHELSTIQEVDSMLTADSLHVSQPDLPPEATPQKMERDVPNLNVSKDSAIKLKMVSLLDPPDLEISELAKSIHFVGEKSTELHKILDKSDAVSVQHKAAVESHKEAAESHVDTVISHEAAAQPDKAAKSQDMAVKPHEEAAKTHEALPEQMSHTPSSESLSVVSKISKSSSSPLISPYESSPASSLSSMSHSKVFSSSLTGSHANYPFLKDIKSLSLHFKNISDIQHKQISTSESSLKPQTPLSPSISNHFTPRISQYDPHVINAKMSKLVESIAKSSTSHPLISGCISESSSGTFQPMTPHSYISSPNVQESAKHLSTFETYGSFKPMTPHSHISTPDIQENSKHLPISESCESFKPMTPHSYISSPTIQESAKHLPLVETYGSFKPVTPHSHISTPNTQENSKDLPISGTYGCFRPMTPHSHISTPDIQESSKHLPISESCGSFKPMTPRTDISSPSEVELIELKGLCPEYASSSGSFKALSPHSHLSSPLSVEHIEIMKKVVSSGSSKFHPLSIRFDISSPQSESPQFNYHVNLENNNVQQSSIAAELHRMVVNSNSSENSEEILKKIVADLASSSKMLCKKNVEKASTEKLSEDLCNEQDNQEAQAPFGIIKKQYHNLQAVSSSTGSSSENLSEMFSGSKIAHQSTPIKSMEEIAQETGIMEEPDLTLMATKLSCKPDTSEIPRSNCSVNLTELSIQNMIERKDLTILSSSNECKTPTMHSPQLMAFADTPSMVSFLKHEISCEEDKTILPEDLNLQQPGIPEIKVTESKEAQKFQKYSEPEYKKRTKRLWSNLEEVKNKKVADERKKVMAVNRMKAKEFAKKLTPKRKT